MPPPTRPADWVTHPLHTARRLARAVLRGPLKDVHLARATAQLRRLERSLPSARARFAIPFAFRGHGWFDSMAPMQHPQEIEALYQIVCELAPRTVVEIGTARGGTLYLWCQAAAADATILSIDMPGDRFGIKGAYSPHRAPFYKAFAKPGQTMHLLRRDSHAPATVQETARVLGGRPIDLLFVDGDHAYAGVKQDVEAYGALVAPGGLIVLHDVLRRPSLPGIEVHRLWDELAAAHDTTTIRGDPGLGEPIGLGVLRKPGAPTPRG